MGVSYFYLHLYVDKESTKIGTVMEMLPPDTDLEFELRMILYDNLKSYMDERGRGDYIVILRDKGNYYKVHLESLGGDYYDTPSAFMDSFMDRYIEFKIKNCNVQLEYEIDDS